MAGIVAILSLIFMIVNVAKCQSCSGRLITAAKDDCTLAINNLRRVGSSSIACQPGECRDQLRDGFARGACWYNYYREETVNDICSGRYDCNSVTVSRPTFISGDVVFSSFCSDVFDDLSREGCQSGINNLRTFGSQNNKACSGRCPELINSALTTCGYDTLNTYTLEEITDYCTGSYDDACGGSNTIKGLPVMVLLALIITYYCL